MSKLSNPLLITKHPAMKIRLKAATLTFYLQPLPKKALSSTSTKTWCTCPSSTLTASRSVSSQRMVVLACAKSLKWIRLFCLLLLSTRALSTSWLCWRRISVFTLWKTSLLNTKNSTSNLTRRRKSLSFRLSHWTMTNNLKCFLLFRLTLKTLVKLSLLSIRWMLQSKGVFRCTLSPSLWICRSLPAWCASTKRLLSFPCDKLICSSSFI